MERYTSTKTIFGAALESARRSGGTFSLVEHSTLNEYFQVESGTALGSGVYPDVAYFAIGRGGHQAVTGASDSQTVIDMKRHRINNPRLFTHLPFIMREVGNDLDDTTRAKYALRVLKTYNGTSYICYYLKRVSTTSESPTISQLTVTDGVTETDDYTQTATMLSNPQAVSSSNNVVNSSSGTYLSVTSPWPISLSADDVSEILNCCEIIYSDERYAELSEIAIVSGKDYTTTSTIGGTSVSYSEVIGAQVYTFVNTYISLPYQSDGVTMNFKIGNSLNYLT